MNTARCGKIFLKLINVFLNYNFNKFIGIRRLNNNTAQKRKKNKNYTK